MKLVFTYAIQVLKIEFVVLGLSISLWEVLLYSVLASLVSSIIIGLLK